MNVKETFKEFAKRTGPSPGGVYNLRGSSAALLLALCETPYLMVEPSEDSARTLYDDVMLLRRMAGTGGNGPCLVPPPNGAQASGERAGAALSLHSGRCCSAIASPEALDSPLWRAERLGALSITLRAGAETPREGIDDRLVALGYRPAPIVAEPGQYRLKGWILDVYPPGRESPLRAEFFGDVVETLRDVELDSQRSGRRCQDYTLLPAREPGGDEEGIPLREALGSRGRLELFTSSTVSGLDDSYVPLSRFPIRGRGLDAGTMPISGLGVLPSERKSIGGLADAVGRLMRENRVVLFCSSPAQAERLSDILIEGGEGGKGSEGGKGGKGGKGDGAPGGSGLIGGSGVMAPLIEPEEIAAYRGAVSITVGALSGGFRLPGLVVLAEPEMFGERPQPARRARKGRVSRLLTTLEDLSAGDYVVHSEHGIGRFTGILRQSAEGIEEELMALEYARGARLYIPLHRIESVTKYRAGEGAKPGLDSLGTKKWQKRRERVRKKVKDMAEKLIKVSAEREVQGGFAFSPGTELHREFDGFFPYEETPDQLRAAFEIKADMESPRPMERLLAGDVGYGKTEVAVRAAFKAVYDAKQVAVLVPTTLLCEQHLRTFRARFSAFPVNIDYLSRFKPKKSRDATLTAAARGELDIVIGTHALLKASFKDLGLLIIDEEHRFGVAQKERLKKMRKGVDVLTLSATPIPRTLQMALSGIRGMSVIETPPEDRLSVKAVVSVPDDALVARAIERELGRKGQVFFVHNRIKGIERVMSRVQALAPGARVGLAHGRMRAADIEKTMLKFLNRELDVLVTTAIIGSGLDIPNANTIVVEMADRMGLADLYQLKGRVGRSSVRAYAYFIAPAPDGLEGTAAQKRLEALEELSYLGAGFRLALKDLEIRGAGNLLGPEQSGNVNDVGFDMYVEMLQKAVSELKGQKVEKPARCEVSLKLNAFIPEDYIAGMSIRLGAYRRIASAASHDELEDLTGEMKERFGPPPSEFVNLIRVMELKVMAQGLKITSIAGHGGAVRFIFAPEARVSADAVLAALGGRKLKFFPDGFELVLEKTPGPGGAELYADISGALRALIENKGE